MAFESIIKTKSYLFAIEIIKASQCISSTKKEFVLSKQLLRCGTSIGAMIREVEFAQSNADFINKFSIALKEANECEYKLCLLKDSDYLKEEEFEPLQNQVLELIRLLVATIKTLKSKETSKRTII
jgi:four helix bundle protein